MKVCSRCNKEKDDSEFYQRKNRSSGMTSMCKACTLEYMKERRDALMIQINKYKENKGCAKCGEKRFYLLDFHHTDQDQKEFTISNHTRKTFEKILPEIEKCVVLCANCHREYHYLNDLKNITTQDYLEGKP